MSFRIDLPAYRGPLDLLLYLVRRSELDLTTLSLSSIVDQFVQYLDVLSELDVNYASDFLEMAAILLELKSQAVLPRQDEQTTGDAVIDEPQEGLVERLLEYRQFRDASSVIEELGVRWQQRYARLSDDLPARQNKLGDQPIADLELWDLVSAFGRIMRESKGPPKAEVIQDETPIHVHMQRIHLRLTNENAVEFNDLFEPGMHKTTLIGIFLAMLELTRHHGVRAEQDSQTGDIRIIKSANFSDDLRVNEVDNYDASKTGATNLPVAGR
jgi:segregation and condensation protein A